MNKAIKALDKLLSFILILLAFGVRALLRRPAVTFSEPLIEQAVSEALTLAVEHGTASMENDIVTLVE